MRSWLVGVLLCGRRVSTSDASEFLASGQGSDVALDEFKASVRAVEAVNAFEAGVMGRLDSYDASKIPSYNLTRAIYLAEASYCMSNASAAVRPSKLASEGVEVSWVYEARGARVIVGYDSDSDELFVSFRGTENYENWWDNLHVVKAHPYPSLPTVGVEDGFAKWYEGLLDGVKDGLAQARASHFPESLAPVLVVGHSAGGACSTLMAFDILRGGVFDDVKLNGHITFGSPRVGNAAFVDAYVSLADQFDVEYYRVTHAQDVIPHMPETALGFHHIPNELWQRNDTAYVVNCDDSKDKEDPLCSNSCSPLHCTSKADHLLYLREPLGIAGCV